ncbi:acyl carrier protein [Mycobacterium intracellulare]|uniref:Acyl carrier protein n=1 Tax=Mycobacterium intracellulare TaxID=1767 RepID=A0AAE4RBB3_MYCIT|nr:acyl carrier protein [Mycobacterium intracellulare]MCA2318161.1 acyl carrier protein [Mycobacterium intracellulare]MCA2343055.1 acyl carrier protein [Mycobacterium intracellulare]MDV6974767.1 acyl carrier protein [Mycobacterium intracellulare]MDV6981110.1 acyl carrier protein [Mycobacterium intracellulare]MDV7011508.1 acyl carrier protein [Mycobacterium intracellulare]
MTSSKPPVPSTVDDQLVSVLRDDLDLKFESVTAATRLIDDLGMDSVAFAAGLVAIEERFGTQLSEEDLLTCTTVGDLQAAIGVGVDA